MDQLSNLRRLLAQQSRPDIKCDDERPKLWAFAGGKGGTGKTIIAAAAAYRLSHADIRVLLVDADTVMPGFKPYFDVPVQHAISQWLGQEVSLSQCVAEINDHLHLFACHDPDLLVQTRSGEIFSRLMDQAQEYELIIADLPSGFSDLHRQVYELADELTLVSGADYTAIASAYAFIKLLNPATPKNGISVVINQVVAAEEAVGAFNKLEKTVKHFLATELEFKGGIRKDEQISRFFQEMVPMICWPLDLPFFTDLEKILEQEVTPMYNTSVHL